MKYRCHGPFEHPALFEVDNPIDLVGASDKFGNEYVIGEPELISVEVVVTRSIRRMVQEGDLGSRPVVRCEYLVCHHYLIATVV